MSNPKASVYFYHKGLIKYIGVMLKGKYDLVQRGHIVLQRRRHSPDYCVLRFTAESGRYYCDLKTESFTIQ